MSPRPFRVPTDRRNAPYVASPTMTYRRRTLPMLRHHSTTSGTGIVYRSEVSVNRCTAGGIASVVERIRSKEESPGRVIASSTESRSENPRTLSRNRPNAR
ncbi:hypothetical protein ACL02O_10225 [Micromonospora sp. MS34]|uniref:hypothetical protein n=1 Tax=Micromonospora sp. MS34 TaxID=3385971 RepID=UPI0039A0BA2C